MGLSSFFDKKITKKLWLSYKKTVLVPWNCPEEKIQTDFIENIFNPLLKLAEKKEIHLLFADPTHKIHNTINGKCWQTRWKAGTIMLKSNTWRKRITILWAINVVNNKKLTSIITEDNCDKEMAKALLEEIRKDYSDWKEIVIIKDNASYHHAVEVQELAKKLNIRIVFLPPYCPNLNLIERVWKFMKSKFKNIYFPTFNCFHDAICNFFGNFKQYEEEISTILN